MSGGHPGNQNGVKIKEPDLRKKAYEQYCQWVAAGKTGRNFTFHEGDLKCTGKTIQKYIKEDPTEFPPIHTEFAKAQGEASWEEVAYASAKGQNKDANTASLQMIMRNKYGWDKPEVNAEEAMVSLDKMREFFKSIS